MHYCFQEKETSDILFSVLWRMLTHVLRIRIRELVFCVLLKETGALMF